MTCPRCKCPECAKVELNAVLRCVISRETILDDTETRAAFELWPGGKRFREPREPGKPPVDPDAEQLAPDVVREQVRVAG